MPSQVVIGLFIGSGGTGNAGGSGPAPDNVLELGDTVSFLDLGDGGSLLDLG